MAHKKAGGSTRLGRDSAAQRLGVKRFGGQPVLAGHILIRQRGSRFVAGPNVARGKDDTLYALIGGIVRFAKRTKLKFNGSREVTRLVMVDPTAASREPLKPSGLNKVG